MDGHAQGVNRSRPPSKFFDQGADPDNFCAGDFSQAHQPGDGLSGGKKVVNDEDLSPLPRYSGETISSVLMPLVWRARR